MAVTDNSIGVHKFYLLEGDIPPRRNVSSRPLITKPNLNWFDERYHGIRAREFTLTSYSVHTTMLTARAALDAYTDLKTSGVQDVVQLGVDLKTTDGQQFSVLDIEHLRTFDYLLLSGFAAADFPDGGDVCMECRWRLRGVASQS